MIIDHDNLYVWPRELQFHEEVNTKTSEIHLTATLNVTAEQAIKILKDNQKQTVHLIKVNELVTEERMNEVRGILARSSILTN